MELKYRVSLRISLGKLSIVNILENRSKILDLLLVLALLRNDGMRT
jgi:hypothetical protein